MDFKDIIYNRNPLLILSYISRYRKNIYGSQMAAEIGINQGSTSILLKNFKEMGILDSQDIGRTILYNANSDNPIIKAFRVFENLIEINLLVYELKDYSRKIILFGSCSRGEDTVESDIDIFIIVDEDGKELVINKISEYKSNRAISPVIVTPLEMMDMAESDEVFMKEVEKGIELWGGKI